MLSCIMLLVLVRLSGADVSCAVACARCSAPTAGSELKVVYCSLCRECRDRRREWLETAPPRRQLAPVTQLPNTYHKQEAGAYYKQENGAVWMNAAPTGYIPENCPPPPRCDDGGEFMYVKVYGLKRDATCPPVTPCEPTLRPPPPRTYTPPPPRPTLPPPSLPPTNRPFTLPPSQQTFPPPVPFPSTPYANQQCCPMFFMPMMPYSCVCPPLSNGAYGAAFGMGGYGAGTYGQGTNDPKVHQSAGDQTPGGTKSPTKTEPLYLYIGIPKDIQDLAGNKI